VYPEIEPYDQGMLDVGEGHRIYWETCGNPAGKPALVVHGGPGSGATPSWRRFFDPKAYRIILFDQRNAYRSSPYAGQPVIDLTTNTTDRLIHDMERLRSHFGVDRWLLLGGSWGSTLIIAYVEQYPERVTEIVLFGISTGRHSEMDWLFRGGAARFFPEQWERLLEAVPEAERTGDVVADYNRLLLDPDPAVHRKAAYEWCLWESATPDWPPKQGLMERFQDPAYALAFARIVTHYIRHNAFLEDGLLIRNASRLSSIPGVLINGRYDFQSPIGNAWVLKQAWPRADLVIVDDAGHGGDRLGEEMVRATGRFAGPRK
jgi:proline iminopeptidase